MSTELDTNQALQDPEEAGEDGSGNATANDNEDEHSHPPPKKRPPPTRAQAIFGWSLGDVSIYLTIINLFAEYIDKVKVDSFTISIVTSIVLKLVLEGVHKLQHYFHHVFCHREGKGWKVVGTFFIWIVLFGSKFLIFWLDGLLFPNKIDLGGLKIILVLSVVLMATEQIMRRIYFKLGEQPPEEEKNPETALSDESP